MMDRESERESKRKKERERKSKRDRVITQVHNSRAATGNKQLSAVLNCYATYWPNAQTTQEQLFNFQACTIFRKP